MAKKMNTKRTNTKYVAVWKKTHESLKKISKKRMEPMTVVVQRAVELLDK